MEHAQHAHTAYLCSGETWPAHGGSWIGHVLPGIFLVAWGLHWFISASFQSFTGIRKQPLGASHKVVFLPGTLQSVEPWLKIIFPAIAITLEFSLSGTRYLRCPSGSAKAGELDVSHMNSWSHGTNYPPLMLSGLVDLIHTHWVPLPHGVPQFFLSAAFGTSAYLMLAHTKAEPLDGLVHRLLGYCMAAVAVAVLAQVATRGRSFALNAAKSLALIMEGCWFFAITHIMFSSDTTWNASHPDDMTRVMFTPVLFTWIFIGVTTFLLLIYLTMHVLLAGLHNIRPGSKQTPAKGMPGSFVDTIHAGSNSSSGFHDGVKLTGQGRMPWRYLKLGTQQQQQQWGDDEVVRDDASVEGDGSSDTSIEMV